VTQILLILPLSRWLRFFAVTGAMILSSTLALAQNATGRIVGTITDEQGASIAGAKVTVTNTSTNVRWEATTNTSGTYQVLDLPIGTYTLTAEHEGFAKVVTAPHPLEIKQSLRIDVRMKIGSVAEVVKVESEAAQVETINPTVDCHRRKEAPTGCAVCHGGRSS
jgi:hypothetical protein